MSTNVMMKAALSYAGCGLKVIPLHSFMGSGCSCNNGNCESPGKHPRIERWKGSATSDLATIRRWWTTWPEANIGIATGKKSNLVVIEVVGEQGAENFRRLCEEHNHTRATLTAVSASGRQLYFSPPDWGIPKGLRTIADGMDVHGGGGYVVAPPSSDQSGLACTWEGETIEELPPWLFSIICQFEADVAGENSKAMPPARVEAKETISQTPITPAAKPSKTTPPPMAKETTAQCLIRLVGAASLFHNQDREAFASVTENGCNETWMVNSGDFENWLRCSTGWKSVQLHPQPLWQKPLGFSKRGLSSMGRCTRSSRASPNTTAIYMLISPTKSVRSSRSLPPVGTSSPTRR